MHFSLGTSLAGTRNLTTPTPSPAPGQTPPNGSTPAKPGIDLMTYCLGSAIYRAFAEGGPSLKMQRFFIYYFILFIYLFFFLGGGGWGAGGGGRGREGGGSRWWLVGSVHITFGKAYMKYCILPSPKRAECFRVYFHCLSGVIMVTLNRSYRTRTYAPDAGDHGELFWSGFGWDDSHPYTHTEVKYTSIMPVLFQMLPSIDTAFTSLF